MRYTLNYSGTRFLSTDYSIFPDGFRLKFLSKRLVLLLHGNQYSHLCFVHKTTYLWLMRSPGGGESSLSACPRVGNRLPSEKKNASPRGCAREGMVTGRIEPCIYTTIKIGLAIKDEYQQGLLNLTFWRGKESLHRNLILMLNGLY